MPSGPGPYRSERQVSIVRPDIEMKNDSPRRKKKRLNSLFEGMETTEQTRKSERDNTTGSTSKGKAAADLRPTELAKEKQKTASR